MSVAVRFHDEQLDLDLPEDRLLGVWNGPTGLPSAKVGPIIRQALENPHGFPPLRQAVVPGDQCVVAWDTSIPDANLVLKAICDILGEVGVEPGSIRVVAAGSPPEGWTDALPPGVSASAHDPEDRSQLAYLASSSQGRRIYLNRHLTDADFVMPVGLLGYDPVLGYRGPWGVVFPGLSDSETQKAYRVQANDDLPDPQHPRAVMTESEDVSWLLGSQLQLAIVPGERGIIGAFAGIEADVRSEATRAHDAAWSFRPEQRAELVIVGIGGPGRRADIDDLAEALATGARLVRRGGKIVALSRVEGPIGPALGRLIDADDDQAASSRLKGAEGQPDFPAAKSLAHTLAWADVYLLSALDEQRVEDLSMIALARPEEALRLARASESCLVVSRADLTRAQVADEND